MRTAASCRCRTKASWPCSTASFSFSWPRTAPASGASTTPFADAGRSLRPRELAERGLQQRGELGVVAELFARQVERGLCIPRPITKIDQRGVDIIVNGSASRRYGLFARRLRNEQLVAQLEHDAVRRFFPDARNRRQLPHVASRHGLGEIGRIDARQNLLRQRRSDARDRDQLLERELLLTRRESVKRKRVLANVRVNRERDVPLPFELVVRLQRYVYFIPDAARDDERARGVELFECAFEVADHFLRQRVPLGVSSSTIPRLTSSSRSRSLSAKLRVLRAAFRAAISASISASRLASRVGKMSSTGSIFISAVFTPSASPARMRPSSSAMLPSRMSVKIAPNAPAVLRSSSIAVSKSVRNLPIS